MRGGAFPGLPRVQGAMAAQSSGVPGGPRDWPLVRPGQARGEGATAAGRAAEEGGATEHNKNSHSNECSFNEHTLPAETYPEPHLTTCSQLLALHN